LPKGEKFEVELSIQDIKEEVPMLSSMDDCPLHQIADTIRHVGIGTGYGFDMDWRHGMYQGPRVVQGVELDTIDDAGGLWGLCENVARFELGSEVGYGLHEYGFFGPFARYGI
jgi:hypothetical protein